MATSRFALTGSARQPQEDARIVGTPNPAEIIEVTLLLRRQQPLAPAQGQAPVARTAFAARHGARPDDATRVEQFAQMYDLTVVGLDLARRSVVLSGTVAAMCEAFGTSLKLYQSPHGTYRGRAGVLYPPADLQDIIVGVFGLDNRPQATSRCRRKAHAAQPNAAGSQSYTPPDVAKLYRFPAGTGEGQTVAILELGGGYKLADLREYFGRLGIAMPAVTAVSVDGAHNAPTGDPAGADGEVLLDVEVIGAIAPRARLVVYFAPNTDKGFLDAITTAVHDAARAPSIVSISWGGPESSWTSQALEAFDEAFQDAAALGITVCCACGDGGSSDGVSDGHAHVDFPSSSPHVLACGGTRLEASNGAGGNGARESVWNDGTPGGATGGGVSEVFALPAYQRSRQVPASVNRSHFKGRGVPDVAGNADPETGYAIHVDGHDAVVGGTSAVAPLWAALVALGNEAAGRSLGYINPGIYSAATPAGAFRDITSGDNGAYRAKAGWDACTGLGSPNGTLLFPHPR